MFFCMYSARLPLGATHSNSDNKYSLTRESISVIKSVFCFEIEKKNNALALNWIENEFHEHHEQNSMNSLVFVICSRARVVPCPCSNQNRGKKS